MAQVYITPSIYSLRGWHFGKRRLEVQEREDIIARFWRNVHRGTDSECWLWRGYIGDRGYGVIGGGKARIRAHRLSWLIHHGPIPDGKVVCHNCDVTMCVNPAHLRVDSHKGNLHESVRKGRKRAWGLQRLDAEQVLAIRQMVAGGTLQYEVAAVFGISRNHVSSIVNRACWRHLDDQVSECPSTPTQVGAQPESLELRLGHAREG